MALIHENFYRSKDFARIDFDDSIRKITNHLFNSYSVDPNAISLKINGEGVFLDINSAIPCGLIINELVSNSLKHAFPESKGEIRIGLHSNDKGKLILDVGDNGMGLPKDLDFRNTNSLGFRLLNALVNQLSCDIKLQRSGGTTFKITFNTQKQKTLFTSCKHK